jgi:hypothetical protein
MSQYFNVRSGGPHIGRHSPSASDAEERPALLNEIKKSSLGIYRPLNYESQEDLQNRLDDALLEITPEMEIRRAGMQLGDFVVKQEMGITYLKERDFRKKKNKLPLFLAGFRLKNDLDAIQKGVWMPKGTPLEVGIDLDHMEWTDFHGRSLALFFDKYSEGYERLQQEKECISSVLGEFSVNMASAVNTPNHLTVIKYGQGNDHNKLGYKDKKYIIDKVGSHLSEMGINSVLLDPVVAGKQSSDSEDRSYRNEHEYWEKSARRQAQLRIVS